MISNPYFPTRYRAGSRVFVATIIVQTFTGEKKLKYIPFYGTNSYERAATYFVAVRKYIDRADKTTIHDGKSKKSHISQRMFEIIIARYPGALRRELIFSKSTEPRYSNKHNIY